MKSANWIIPCILFAMLSFWFGDANYYNYTAWFYGGSHLTSPSTAFIMTAGLVNGLLFAVSSLITSLILLPYKNNLTFIKFTGLEFCMFIVNIVLFSIFVGVHKYLSGPPSEAEVSVDATNFYFYPELIISTLITLISFGILYVKALPKNPKDGIRKSI